MLILDDLALWASLSGHSVQDKAVIAELVTELELNPDRASM